MNHINIIKRQDIYGNGLYIGGGMRIKKASEVGGITFRKPEPSFEKDCLAGKDLPIICDKCLHADVKESKCSEFKIDKKKFHQLQDNEYCSKFEKIA